MKTDKIYLNVLCSKCGGRLWIKGNFKRNYIYVKEKYKCYKCLNIII